MRKNGADVSSSKMSPGGGEQQGSAPIVRRRTLRRSEASTTAPNKTCAGCASPFAENQMGHMGPGGCMEGALTGFCGIPALEDIMASPSGSPAIGLGGLDSLKDTA